MANIYIDAANGDGGTGDGPIGNPYKTLQVGINNATGGDSIFLADNVAHILTAAINWDTGFTISNNFYLKIKPYSVNGAITIQRPDESSPRMGAIIDGNNTAVDPFIGSGTKPTAFSVENIKFQNFTTYTYREPASYATVFGCEFDCSSVGNNVAVRWETGGKWAMFYNNYIHSYTGSASVVGANGRILNNYIDTNSTSINGQVWLNGRNLSMVIGNIIKFGGSNVGLYSLQREIEIYGNTIINDGSANAKGIDILNSFDSYIYDNLFYKFDGAGAKPLNIQTANQRLLILGNNAYFDCNSPDSSNVVSMDLQAEDVVGSGNPFTDSINDNYTPTLASGLRGAALSNPNSSLDIGAVQSAASGGGNIFILNT